MYKQIYIMYNVLTNLRYKLLFVRSFWTSSPLRPSPYPLTSPQTKALPSLKCDKLGSLPMVLILYWMASVEVGKARAKKLVSPNLASAVVITSSASRLLRFLLSNMWHMARSIPEARTLPKTSIVWSASSGRGDLLYRRSRDRGRAA